MSKSQMYRYIATIAIYIFMQFSSFLMYFFNPFTAFDLIPDGYTLEETGFFMSGQWGFYSFLIATLLVVGLNYRDFFSRDTRSDLPAGRLILWVIFGIFLAFFVQILSGLVIQYVFGITERSQNTVGLLQVAELVPIFALVICIFAPILEEIIFRGILFKAVADQTNFFVGVLFSSIVFACIHMDFSHFISYFAIGFAFAYLYHKTNRLIVPIIAHASMNSIVVLAQFAAEDLDIQALSQMIFLF